MYRPAAIPDAPIVFVPLVKLPGIVVVVVVGIVVVVLVGIDVMVDVVNEGKVLVVAMLVADGSVATVKELGNIGAVVAVK
jgi:hypothetical protein